MPHDEVPLFSVFSKNVCSKPKGDSDPLVLEVKNESSESNSARAAAAVAAPSPRHRRATMNQRSRHSRLRRRLWRLSQLRLKDLG